MVGVQRKFTFSILTCRLPKFTLRLVTTTTIRRSLTPGFRAVCMIISRDEPKQGRLRCANGSVSLASCRDRRPLHGCPCTQRHHSRVIFAGGGCPDCSSRQD